MNFHVAPEIGDARNAGRAHQEQVAAAEALPAQPVEGADRAGIGGANHIGRRQRDRKVAIPGRGVQETLQDRGRQQRMIAGGDQQRLGEVDAAQGGGDAGGGAFGGRHRFQHARAMQRLQAWYLEDHARILDANVDALDAGGGAEGLDHAQQHRHSGDRQQRLVRDTGRFGHRIIRAAAAGQDQGVHAIAFW